MKRIQRQACPTLLGFLLLLVCGGAAAEDSPGKLRSEMAKVEKQYLELYNKLNTDRRFDIICVMEEPTGSKFPVRVCQPRYQIDAKQKSASERMQAAVAASATAGPANTSGPNVGVAAAGGAMSGQTDMQQAFRQNILDVQQNSPELLALGQKRDELQQRYAEATRAK